jgi:ubiquinone/menaquinone biosynthesis C-methylase UbiE
MVDDDQALAYSEADFAESHQAAVTRFTDAFPAFAPARLLDLACGPADITVRFARALPGTTIVGVDGSPAMLALGVQRLEHEGLTGRITLVHQRLPGTDLGALGRFDAVVSTSSLHHFHDPSVLWGAMRASAAPGARLFVQDLMRPPTLEAAQELVERYAAGEPDVLRRDFLASLRAAFTPDEVRSQLAAAGLGDCTVEPVTDRHLTVHGRLVSA